MIKTRLKVIRAELNMSQETLARKAGISRVTLSAIENGKVKPDYDTIAKLVSATGTPANQIFFELNVV